jgi:hypothetical protein
MPVFFDIDKLEYISKGCPFRFMSYLEQHASKRLPSKKDKYPLLTKIAGQSFLLNPSDLLKDKGTDILFKLQYVKLAARRDYLFWKVNKYKGLVLSYFPDLILSKTQLKQNPLLVVTESDINFKYE